MDALLSIRYAARMFTRRRLQPVRWATGSNWKTKKEKRCNSYINLLRSFNIVSDFHVSLLPFQALLPVALDSKFLHFGSKGARLNSK